jgi:hypothetical protein
MRFYNGQHRHYCGVDLQTKEFDTGDDLLQLVRPPFFSSDRRWVSSSIFPSRVSTWGVLFRLGWLRPTRSTTQSVIAASGTRDSPKSCCGLVN